MSPELVIMLVDNDSTDNLISSKIIEHSRLHTKILDFISGRSALQFLENNAKNPSSLPDLIFLDMNMPVVNGQAFLEEVEKLAPALMKCPSVVVLSSYSSTSCSNKQFVNERVIKYLNKPLSQSGLTEVLKEFSKLRLKVA